MLTAKELNAFEPQRILVCQQRQIGDVLLATPALELLKKRFPEARIHLFTEKKCEPLLRHNPHIHLLHLLDKAEQPRLGDQLRWYKQVAAAGFDLVIDFQQLPRCRMLTWFTRARVRLSFPAPWYLAWLYNARVTPAKDYAAASKASLLAPFGVRWHGESPRIYLREEEKRQARDMLAAAGFGPGHTLITVDPTHRRASKRWSAQNYVQTINIMSAADSSLRFLLLRGPGEDGEVEAIRAASAFPDRIFIPRPAPELRISAACMALAKLHIGNCSAPRHMAVAVDVPSLAIPGASGPEWTHPSPRHAELRPHLPCQPCSKTSCSAPRCLELVTPQSAADTALAMLRQFGAASQA